MHTSGMSKFVRPRSHRRSGMPAKLALGSLRHHKGQPRGGLTRTRYPRVAQETRRRVLSRQYLNQQSSGRRRVLVLAT